MMQRLILAAMVILLSACGWQLRNSQLIPSNIGSLHIATQAADNIFVSELARALDVYGVDVASNMAEANFTVVIVDFRENRRIGTLNSSARAAEYQLNEDVDFLITDPSGKPLTNLLTASVERSYEIEETDILSSDNEERQVRAEMREEIVRQILNRLKALPAQNKENTELSPASP